MNKWKKMHKKLLNRKIMKIKVELWLDKLKEKMKNYSYINKKKFKKLLEKKKDKD